MTQRGTLEIVQVVVKVDDGELCAVSLPNGCADYLLAVIQTFAEGPIKLARLPGVKMVPISELQS